MAAEVAASSGAEISTIEVRAATRARAATIRAIEVRAAAAARAVTVRAESSVIEICVSGETDTSKRRRS